MSTLSAEMAFEIGDVVYFRTAEHRHGTRPKPFIVTGREIEECPGGIQKHYKLGGVSGTAHEMELTKEIPPYQKGAWVEGWMEEKEFKDKNTAIWKIKHVQGGAEMEAPEAP